jgi:hypothetical protein
MTSAVGKFDAMPTHMAREGPRAVLPPVERALTLACKSLKKKTNRNYYDLDVQLYCHLLEATL